MRHNILSVNGNECDDLWPLGMKYWRYSTAEREYTELLRCYVDKKNEKDTEI